MRYSRSMGSIMNRINSTNIPFSAPGRSDTDILFGGNIDIPALCSTRFTERETETPSCPNLQCRISAHWLRFARSVRMRPMTSAESCAGWLWGREERVGMVCARWCSIRIFAAHFTTALCVYPKCQATSREDHPDSSRDTASLRTRSIPGCVVYGMRILYRVVPRY